MIRRLGVVASAMVLYRGYRVCHWGFGSILYTLMKMYAFCCWAHDCWPARGIAKRDSGSVQSDIRIEFKTSHEWKDQAQYSWEVLCFASRIIWRAHWLVSSIDLSGVLICLECWFVSSIDLFGLLFWSFAHLVQPLLSTILPIDHPLQSAIPLFRPSLTIGHPFHFAVLSLRSTFRPPFLFGQSVVSTPLSIVLCSTFDRKMNIYKFWA